MIGAVLAGGLGTRLGAPSKPAVLLGGRPLVEYPLEALEPVCRPVAVVCRAGTALPELPAGVLRWDEPDDGERHPAAGIVHALNRAAAPVLVCAADMPFLTLEVCAGVIRAASGAPEAAAVVGTAGGRLQPLLAVYRPAALAALEGVGDRPLTTVVRGLAPVEVQVPERATRSVNTPEELAAAEAARRA